MEMHLSFHAGIKNIQRIEVLGDGNLERQLQSTTVLSFLAGQERQSLVGHHGIAQRVRLLGLIHRLEVKILLYPH